MANLFGFNFTGGVLGHYMRLHIECNTLFHWLDYMFEYNEEDNSIKLILELCKVQLYFAISSNIQDVFNFVNTSYFVRQDHNLLSDEDLEDNDDLAKIIEDTQ